MRLKVCFIHRKSADTPSIERVFDRLEKELSRLGVEIENVRLPYGNDVPGIVGNLLRFRPPPADLYHITGHVHYIALKLPGPKTLITVHDLGILHRRKGLRRAVLKKLFFARPFRRAAALTAISEATRRDMVRLAGCRPDAIDVIPDPLCCRILENARNFNAGRPTILQVGTAHHKNLASLVAAIKGLNCHLLIVGKPDNEIYRLLADANVDHSFASAATDDEMCEIYRKSDILVFCSTFEGFGLPIIEAQALRVNVVTSDLEPMNVVAGKGAMLVDPRDPSAIRSAIELLIHDEHLRDDLIRKGLDNVRRFDPSDVARRYLKVYFNLLETSP